LQPGGLPRQPCALRLGSARSCRLQPGVLQLAALCAAIRQHEELPLAARCAAASSPVRCTQAARGAAASSPVRCTQAARGAPAAARCAAGKQREEQQPQPCALPLAALRRCPQPARKKRRRRTGRTEAQPGGNPAPAPSHHRLSLSLLRTRQVRAGRGLPLSEPVACARVQGERREGEPPGSSPEQGASWEGATDRFLPTALALHLLGAQYALRPTGGTGAGFGPQPQVLEGSLDPSIRKDPIRVLQFAKGARNRTPSFQRRPQHGAAR